MTDFVLLGVTLFGLTGWLLYFRERRRSRDYATDLSQVIHDYPESTDSLRRSLKWDEIDADTDTDETNEYDGPELGEPIKFTVLVGPPEGANIMPMQNGGVYITPETAYQLRNGEWVDLEMDTEPLFRTVATYVDPQAIREGKQQNPFHD